MRFGTVKRGWRTIENKRIYFDSKAEANYYRILLFLKHHNSILDFEFHPPSFEFSEIRHGTSKYELDFMVKETNGIIKYIEIKGTDDLSKMDQKSRTKINRFRKYFPDHKLDIISVKRVQQMCSQMKGLIRDLE